MLRLRGESQIVHFYVGSASTSCGWYALRQCDAMGEVTSLEVELPLSVQYQTHKPRAPCQRARERQRERGGERIRESEQRTLGLTVAGEEADGDPAGELAPLLIMADGAQLVHMPGSLAQILLFHSSYQKITQILICFQNHSVKQNMIGDTFKK